MLRVTDAKGGTFRKIEGTIETQEELKALAEILHEHVHEPLPQANFPCTPYFTIGTYEASSPQVFGLFSVAVGSYVQLYVDAATPVRWFLDRLEQLERDNARVAN